MATDPEPSAASSDDARPTPWGLILSIVAAIVIVGGAIAIAAGMGGDDTAAPTTSAGSDDATATTLNPLLQTKDVTGQPAPTTPFETFEGGSASFADYAGTPLVVNFFSSTCTPCLQEMPDFESVKQAHDGAVTFLGMNVADTVDSGMNVVQRTGVTWELGRDPSGELLSEIGGVGMPTTMIIDADGIIVFMHSGQLSAAELEQHLVDAGVAPATVGTAP